MRATAADNDTTDDAFATGFAAFFISPLIGHVLFLEFSFFSVNIPVIRH